MEVEVEGETFMEIDELVICVTEYVDSDSELVVWCMVEDVSAVDVCSAVDMTVAEFKDAVGLVLVL